MRMRIHVAALVLAACATPAYAEAQTDSAQSLPALFAKVDSLKAQVDTLLMVIGDYRNPANLSVRPPELPNREYPVMFRQRQLGVGVDDFGKAFQAQISGLAARVAVLEAQSAGGQPVGTAVFDKIRANKVCVGDVDCDGDWNADIQIRKNYSSVIGMEANLALVDPQDRTHTHRSQLSVSQDGGTRLQQNAMSSFSRGFVSHVNTCREWLNFGPDSRGNLSLYKGGVRIDDNGVCTIIPHDGSQDLVFLPDEDAREFKFFFPRPLWNVRLIGSTTVNAGDLTLQPKQ